MFPRVISTALDCIGGFSDWLAMHPQVSPATLEISIVICFVFTVIAPCYSYRYLRPEQSWAVPSCHYGVEGHLQGLHGVYEAICWTGQFHFWMVFSLPNLYIKELLNWIYNSFSPQVIASIQQSLLGGSLNTGECIRLMYPLGKVGNSIWTTISKGNFLFQMLSLLPPHTILPRLEPLLSSHMQALDQVHYHLWRIPFYLIFFFNILTLVQLSKSTPDQNSKNRLLFILKLLTMLFTTLDIARWGWKLMSGKTIMTMTSDARMTSQSLNVHLWWIQDLERGFSSHSSSSSSSSSPPISPSPTTTPPTRRWQRLSASTSSRLCPPCRMTSGLSHRR